MKKNRAYSFLTIKSIDEDKREITGIATTPEVDAAGDIVELAGIEYKLPLPFLKQHDHNQPIGEVFYARKTDKGLEIKARIAKVSEPSQLSARLTEAWELIKTGLMKGLSIGFKPMEYSIIEETGGVRFTKSRLFEISAVVVPANYSGQITSAKHLIDIEDSQPAAISEKKEKKPLSKANLGASGKTKQVKLTKIEDKPMNITEKLKQFRESLNAKRLERTKLAEKSAESGETFDEADQESFDTLTQEIAALVKHIGNLEVAEKDALSTATPVTEKAGQSEAGANAARVGVQVKAEEKLEKGIEFARYAMCLTASKGDARQALDIAKTHYGNNNRIISVLDFQAKGGKLESVMKADVSAGTTLNSTWAAPLVQYQDFAGDFVEYLRPRTIIGQFGNGSIPSLNRIPFNVRIPAQTSGGTAYWVGEGAPKPVTKYDFDTDELRWAKCAAIAVLTEELIRFSNPSAERLVRDSLGETVIAKLDTDFINPAKTAVSNVSPASITNGANTVASSGTDAQAVRCDLQALWAFFIAANNAPRNAVYIMNSTVALAVSLMQNPLGQSEFPGLTLNGGTFMGVPTIVSDYVPAGVVALVNASDIWLADDGQVTIDASREASLQMLDNPTNNSATPTATSMVSMFQTNSVALRAERYINWARRRASGVAYLTGVAWGACPTT